VYLPGLVARNIPTRVGKTSPCATTRPVLPEHPHARGENRSPLTDSGCPAGTSPRAWGKLVMQSMSRSRGRNIPTRVGKTEHPARSLPPDPEHPHARGENPLFLQFQSEQCGTSPRAWGKLHLILETMQKSRNIPTRVGKTYYSGIVERCTAEHPHARGENFRL